MFNISFSEVFIVGAVGLIIIGPKRLPETARFIGHLLGRMQRQIASVKNDIRREMQLEDLKSIHQQYADAAQDAKRAFDENINTMKKSADDIGEEVEKEITPPTVAARDDSARPQK